MTRDELAQLADQAADLYGLQRELVHSVVTQESGWNPDAQSSAMAIGLMQLLPSTAREEAGQRRMLESQGGSIPDRYDLGDWATLLHDPALNLTLGCGYLARQLARFGDTRLALAAYNAGPGRVGGLVRQYGEWSQALYQALPSETQQYVDRIMSRLPSWSGGALVLALVAAGALVLMSAHRR